MYYGLKFVFDYLKSKNMSTWIILETAAGQGTELITTKNNSLEEFSSFYNRFSEEDKNYIKICVDTCHIYAAGYDISTEEEVRTFFQEFDEQIATFNFISQNNNIDYVTNIKFKKSYSHHPYLKGLNIGKREMETTIIAKGIILKNKGKVQN
jgi:endonuclease IV